MWFLESCHTTSCIALMHVRDYSCRGFLLYNSSKMFSDKHKPTATHSSYNQEGKNHLNWGLAWKPLVRPPYYTTHPLPRHIKKKKKKKSINSSFTIHQCHKQLFLNRHLISFGSTSGELKTVWPVSSWGHGSTYAHAHIIRREVLERKSIPVFYIAIKRAMKGHPKLSRKEAPQSGMQRPCRPGHLGAGATSPEEFPAFV